MEEDSQTMRNIEAWLVRLENGEEGARDALINYACDRVRRMAGGQLAKEPRVKRWESTDDVLQVSLLKLHRSLADVKPSSAREFMGLAALQIRRTLIDLARHHYGKRGIGHNHETDAAPGHDGLPARNASAVDRLDGPDEIAMKVEFHELVDRLPDDQREVIHLTVYNGLEQAEAAELLGVSASTIKRRKRDGLLALAERLGPEYG